MKKVMKKTMAKLSKMDKISIIGNLMVNDRNHV